MPLYLLRSTSTGYGVYNVIAIARRRCEVGPCNDDKNSQPIGIADVAHGRRPPMNQPQVMDAYLISTRLNVDANMSVAIVLYI